MQLTPHFHLAEFTHSDKAIELGIDNTPAPEHLDNLMRTAFGMEQVRHICGGRATSITSGYRCPRLNLAVGGTATSDHAKGDAADFTIEGLTPYAVAVRLAASKLVFDQLIYEPDRGVNHISFGARLRRQVLTQEGGPGSPFQLGLAA